MAAILSGADTLNADFDASHFARTKKESERKLRSDSIYLVAGGGFEPPTFGL